MANMTIAKEIARQIGQKSLFMIGTKQLIGMENGLILHIGRNEKGVNYIQITLNGMDLYDMEFMSMRAGKKTIKAEENGIYSDQLNYMIERNTGMYTSL